LKGGDVFKICKKVREDRTEEELRTVIRYLQSNFELFRALEA
jgi:hypothetical protein